jgi:hypothetical protein
MVATPVGPLAAMSTIRPIRVGRSRRPAVTVDDDELETRRAATLEGAEKRRDSLVEVTDPDLAHDVLVRSGRKGVAFGADLGREAVRRILGLARELKAAHAGERRSAGSDGQRTVDRTGDDHHARDEEQQLGPDRETM